ncbi:MAG: M20/M25/M40 family metallo-hydrolase [Acidobacteriota bacterium]
MARWVRWGGSKVVWIVLSAAMLTVLAWTSSATDDEGLWITVDREVFEELRGRTEFSFDHRPLQAAGERAGVVATQLRKGDIDRLSALIHRKYHRCGGFLVHGSRAEALETLQRAARIAAPAAVTFDVDQSATVQALAGRLDASLILDTITQLSTSFPNRYYVHPAGRDAALWIRDRWQAAAQGRSDVQVELFDHAGYSQPSVILTFEGATRPDEVLVLGAHLDSTAPGTSNPNFSAPGADDDASGIAVLGEVIRAAVAEGFVPDRTLKFMGYAAEEVGLRGSQDIAASFRAAGTNVVGVVQLDMTAFNGSATDVALLTRFTDSDLTNFLGQLLDTYQPSLQWTTDDCGYACSDHASWFNEGFPTAFPFEAPLGQHNLDIHTTADTVSTFGGTASHALKFARLAAAFIVEAGLVSGGGNAPPQVTISSPAGGAVFTVGDAVTLVASASDAEDGDLSPAVSWSSSRDGALGSGASVTTSSLSIGSHLVTATVSDSAGASDSATVSLTVDPAPGPGCPAGSLDFSSLALASYSNQNGSNGTQVLEAGAALRLTGNTWVRSTSRFTVDSGSVLEFEFRGAVQGEIHALGFDDNDSLNDAARHFQFWGTQNWTGGGRIDFNPKYGGSGDYRTFSIPVGQSYTGSMYLVFTNDDDAASAADATFRCVRLTSSGANAAPTVTITAPAAGASFDEGETVVFTGSASDAEDGDLAPSLSWSSSLDGALGSGASVTASALSSGAHLVTASVTDSAGASASDSVSLTVVGSSACSVEEGFENGAGGWLNDGASTCATGSFVIGNPGQRSGGGVITQVGGSNSGSASAFTAFNSSLGNADVDRGNCIFVSPSWSVGEASTLSVAYWHGQRDSGDDPSGDFFRLELSTDGGGTWSALASNGDSASNAAWATVTSPVPAGSTVRLRVQCSDGTSAGDIVECGIDDVSICR